MKDQFGVVGGIGEGIKIGIFMLQDICCLAAVLVPAYLISTKYFPSSQGIQAATFFVISCLLALYLIMRPFSNPGRRNFEIIWMLLRDRKAKEYKSLGYYEFKSLEEIRSEQKHADS